MTPATTPASALRDVLGPLAVPGALGRDALLDAVTALGEVQAVLDAVKLRIASELENRSRVLGPDNPGCPGRTRHSHSGSGRTLADLHGDGAAVLHGR